MTGQKMPIATTSVRTDVGGADVAGTEVSAPGGRNLEITVTQALGPDHESLAERVIIEIDGSLPVTIYLNDGQVLDWPGEPA